MNTQTTAPATLRCWNCRNTEGITYVTTRPNGMLVYTDCPACGEDQCCI